MTKPLANLAGSVPRHGSAGIRPADNWEFAFVSGNGRLGAMVFGDPADETIIANHCRLFMPLGTREVLPDLAEHVPELRKMIREKGGKTALQFFLAKAKEQGFPGLLWTDPFHPAFELTIRQDFDGTPSDYLRTEDFQTGEVGVRWTADAGAFRRRLFVSRTDNVIVLSMTGPEPGTMSASFDAPFADRDDLKVTCAKEPRGITFHNVYKFGKGGYDAAVRIVPRGGAVTCENNIIRVDGADEVLVLMRVEPFKAGEPGTLEKIKSALAQMPADYATLFKPHAKAHGAIFSRVSLDLGGGADREKSSEELLETAATENRLPPALLEKMYDAGRYMFICASGELPPNLQGIWTGTWNPPWSGDFTLDTNIQSAVGSGLSGNMLECMEGYYNFIESLVPDWRENARKYYGCRGVLSGARASNNGLHLHWGDWPGIFWTAGAGWLAHWFYDHFRYTGDREFLANRTVPLLKEIALFYEDFLIADEDGTLHFIPSYSPETGSGTDATMDIAVAREVLGNLIEACGVLGIEAENVAKWRRMRERLPTYRINQKGELAEWASGDEYEEQYGHPHCSGLYPAFQSYELTPEDTPELWEAARELTRKKVESDGTTMSFNRMQSGMAAAYLGLGEEAYSRLAIMALYRAIYPSLITSHNADYKIFNVDGNGTIPELLNMMLVFSWPGRLDLLPALPEALPRGALKGIMARGQIHIDKLEWDRPAGRVELRLTSRIEQTIILRLPSGARITSAEVSEGEAEIAEAEDTANCRELRLPARETVGVRITFAVC